MKKKISAVIIGILFFYFISLTSEVLHELIDQGYSENQSGSIVLNLIYNTFYYFLAGYLVAFIVRSAERKTAALLGLSFLIIHLLNAISFNLTKPAYYYLMMSISAIFMTTIGANYRKKQTGK